MSWKSKARKRVLEARWVAEMERQDRDAELKELRKKDRHQHQRSRAEYIDALNAQEGRRIIEFAVGGSMFSISKEPGWEMYEGTARAKRGQVTVFSARSRQRMLECVSGLLTTALPLFVTLTYPKSWPDEWRDWKEHLRCFWQRLARKFPAAAAVWKLEPQLRGAPHFHLLLWGVDFIPHEWIARAWWETVGSNDPDHLAAGTSIERAKSARGVQAYCSKKYMGKEVTLPDGWQNVGRWWGVLGRKNLPRAPRNRSTVSKAQAFKFRRLIRRFFRSKGIRSRSVASKGLGRVVVFTQQILDWGRAPDWAGGLDIVPRGLGVPLENTPF